MQSGKRKRKRKSLLHTHVKKRHQNSQPIPIFSASGSETAKNLETVLLSTPTANHSPAQAQAQALHNCNNGDANTRKKKRGRAENGVSNSLRKSSGRRSAARSELKAPDKLAIQIYNDAAKEANNEDGVAESPDKARNAEAARSTGAKRRKSGSVKRFKRDSQLFEAAVTQNLTPGPDFVPVELSAENQNHENGETAALRITKILKPIAYAASVIDDGQDVKVTFQVMRFRRLSNSNLTYLLLHIYPCVKSIEDSFSASIKLFTCHPRKIGLTLIYLVEPYVEVIVLEMMDRFKEADGTLSDIYVLILALEQNILLHILKMIF